MVKMEKDDTDVELPISRRYRSVFQNQFIPQDSDISEMQLDQYGSILCTQGTYLGSVIHIYPEQKILIGRDLNMVDIQINLPLISRIHCELIYHSDSREYEITDYSKNGVFINWVSASASQ